MTRIEVTTDLLKDVEQGDRFDAEYVDPSAFNPEGAWRILDEFILYPHEVIVLPPARHAGYYDDTHPGEQNPDAWDRMGYQSGAGRHLLETGVN